MFTYANTSGKSNVTGWDAGDDWISVQFADGSTYTYTDASAGRDNVLEMKILADAGSGLNSYINHHVRNKYAWKS